MIREGHIREVTFIGTNTDVRLVDTKIESEFTILRNKNWIIYRPKEELVVSSSSYNITEQHEESSSSSYNRTRFELQHEGSSSLHNRTRFESQQLDNDNYELFNEFNNNFELNEFKNFNDDHLTISPSNFQSKFSNMTDIFKNIRKFLREQENITEKVTTIVLAKSVDVGRIIHDVLQNFWNLLAIPNNFNQIFMAGEMFDECTTGSLIIVPNSIL
ncbi:11387_t:CDS:2, partial [Diversispora eburnea]